MARRRKFNRHRKNFRRRRNSRKRNFLNIHPKIFNGISFLILGILLIRFSPFIFIEILSWKEGIFWGSLIGIGLIIGGILSLIAWWKNNVLNLNTKHQIKF